MNRLDQAFGRLKAHGEKALITYIMAGDPSLQDTEQLVLELERAGADIILSYHAKDAARWLDDNANHRVFVEDSTSINLNFDDNLPERQHCAEVAMEFLRDISGRLHNFPTSGSGYHANDPRSLDGV